MLKLVDKYLIFLQQQKQVSENTFKSYSRDLKKLVEYLESQDIDDLRKVDTSLLERYMAYLQKENYAAATITRSFIAIKSAYTFFCIEGDMDTNPAMMIKLPKVEGTPNPILNKEEMELLLKPSVEHSFKGLRDRAMLVLLYHTKISISDLVKLKVSSVNFDESMLHYSQNGQRKEYPMSIETKEALEAYLNYRNPEMEEWLFPNRYGNSMSRQGFWKTIKNYAKEVGIEKEITLYSIKQGEL